jgi:hypothetical protein
MELHYPNHNEEYHKDKPSYNNGIQDICYYHKQLHPNQFYEVHQPDRQMRKQVQDNGDIVF